MRVAGTDRGERLDAWRSADDRQLVEACLAGRRDAFDLIVERHQRRIYQLCYRFVGNHEDAGWDETNAAGISARPESAEHVIPQLSTEERSELARLIEEELRRTGA